MRAPKLGSPLAACARALCAALALFVLLLAGASAETDGTVRVKLARLGSPSVIELRADCGYWLAEDATVRVPAGTALTVSAEGGALTLSYDGRVARLGGSAELVRAGSGSAGVAFASPALSNRFCGDLDFTASGDVITTVLRIYVEDYLYGVVGYEMPPSSGLEALKAQAIVARNYALRQKSARSGASYDLSDAGDALSFRGYSDAGEYADAIRAVDATRGQVLYYDGSPATCYFCDSNGGQTESAANALGTALPYSVVRDDPHDLDGSGVKKTASFKADASDLNPELAAALLSDAAAQIAAQGFAEPTEVKIAAIEDIVLESPRYAEPSRLYRTAAFDLTVAGRSTLGEEITARVTARVPTYGGIEDWYDLSINGEDNETVWISKGDRAFELTFRRSGTGLGMSQRGAQVMARKGLSCETILDYYYPGAELRHLELAAAAPRASETKASEAQAVPDPIAAARLGQKARLYDAADDGASALTTLPAGATVDVYAVQGEWAAVGSGELRGFIHADALTSFRLSGVTAAQVKGETLARISGPTDLLQLPVATAKALATLPDGEVVRLDAYTEAWALVTTQSGAEGFIPRDALTLHAQGDGGDGETVNAPEDLYGLLTRDAGLYVNADDTVAPRQALSEGDYVRILTYNSAWAHVRTAAGDTGYVPLDCLSAVQQARSQAEEAVDGGEIILAEGEAYVYVSADALSLFERWSTDSKVLATLKRGDKLRLGAYNDRWACVRVNGVTGFALRSGLTDEDPGADEAAPAAIEGGEVTVVKGERYAAVAADDTPLYPSWSTGDSPLMRLSAGQRVRVGAYNAIWACVRVDGVTGFVKVEALEKSH